MRYIRRNPLILGAMSLDLFAVLLGGAVALLPVYAHDILHVGARGLGLLRSAPATGAVIMAIVVAHNPPRERAGKALLLGVFGFGLATLVFGFSRHFLLSMAALAACGACDMVSVIVRHTLVQMGTPDEMRGRVSAVNMVFIGASNEVGQFESGITAQWFGTSPSRPRRRRDHRHRSRLDPPVPRTAILPSRVIAKLVRQAIAFRGLSTTRFERIPKLVRQAIVFRGLSTTRFERIPKLVRQAIAFRGLSTTRFERTAKLVRQVIAFRGLSERAARPA